MTIVGRRKEEVVIAAEEAGERLDRVLAARIGDMSRSRLKALILDGEVAIGARTIRDPGHRVNSGDTVSLDVPPPEDPQPRGEDIPLHVVFEDDALIVIDKPKGLVVHPAAGHATGTLVNALIAHCGDSLSGIGGVRRPGIVHRLDKDTTGLLVVAKTDRAHQNLSEQFADHGRTGPLQRAYLAFAWGLPDRPRGTIDAPIDRHPHAREKMAVRPNGREAITHWQVLENYAGTDRKPVGSMLVCRLETGRTHQIRVHLAHKGHPLLGDDLYGPGFKTKVALLTPGARESLQDLGRQALHAYLLGFEHPVSGAYVEFKSELPPDLARLRAALSATKSEGFPREHR
ncbi:MAG TPA: RluA family pseudouridine synthase [Xanthobacteraceae bacterium]|jgi:23S rRNA pseudouridine1911/1915/1917 synthase